MMSQDTNLSESYTAGKLVHHRGNQHVVTLEQFERQPAETLGKVMRDVQTCAYRFTALSSSSDASNGGGKAALVEVNTSMTKTKATVFAHESVKGLEIQIQYKTVRELYFNSKYTKFPNVFFVIYFFGGTGGDGLFNDAISDSSASDNKMTGE
jgi:hypothetical protein